MFWFHWIGQMYAKTYKSRSISISSGSSKWAEAVGDGVMLEDKRPLPELALVVVPTTSNLGFLFASRWYVPI